MERHGSRGSSAASTAPHDSPRGVSTSRGWSGCRLTVAVGLKHPRATTNIASWARSAPGGIRQRLASFTSTVQ